jgi:hypothetical protein
MSVVLDLIMFNRICLSRLSTDILQHLLTDPVKHEFVMEVTDKTRADVKVSTLTLCKHVRLRIIFHVAINLGWHSYSISK